MTYDLYTLHFTNIENYSFISEDLNVLNYVLDDNNPSNFNKIKKRDLMKIKLDKI